MKRLILNKYTWIIAGLLIAGLALWFIFKKKTVYISQVPEDYPISPDQPAANSGLTGAESETVVRLANDLNKSLKGWAFDIFFRTYSPYEEYATCSDKIFTAVYNYFNTNIAAGNGTLRTWIEEDWYFSKSRAGSAVLLIIQRFERLNLV